MEKIVKGILKFRQTKRPEVLERMLYKRKLPSTVFVSCMDARVYPTHFTASEIGDLYMVRNAGNFIPHAKEFKDRSAIISTEPGALELACCRGHVKHMVICGHSDCKAMHLLLQLGKNSKLETSDKYASPLERWVVQRGSETLRKFLSSDKLMVNLDFGKEFDPIEAYVDAELKLSLVDRLSQLNVLQQMANVHSHPILADRIACGNLNVYGMWYEISSADVYLFSRLRHKFLLVDELSSNRILEEFC